MGNKIEADNLTRRGAGRPKGSENKTTGLLKEAILAAAEATGQDGKGKGKLTGYCQFLATAEPKAFAQLLGKVLPTQLVGDPDNPAFTVIERRIVDPRK